MPRKPVWSEGVLVSQHHFQQADLYHEQLLHERLCAISTYDWGVIDLQIDMSALAADSFRVAAFEGIWPDGTYVSCGDGKDQAPPAARDVGDAFEAGADRLDVYLGVVDAGTGGAIIARPHEPKGDRRYVQSLHSVADANGGGNVQELEWAEPDVRIFFGDENRHGHQTIRIAQLMRDSSGRALIRDNCIPPVMHIGTVTYLQSGLNRVLTAAGAKQRELNKARGQRHSGSVDFHSAAAQQFWLLHTLNGTIPVLNHLMANERTHPEKLYLALASFVGQLTSFAPEGSIADIPKFDYLELGDSFEALFARAMALLAGEVQKPYTEVELRRRSEDGMYLGSLKDPELIQKEIFVAIRSSQPEAVVRDRAPGVLKIASWNQIYEVVKQARRGVRMGVEWNPSSALPVRPGVCFFRVQKEGSYWQDVCSTSTLAVALPDEGDWKGATVSVYAIDKRHVG